MNYAKLGLLVTLALMSLEALLPTPVCCAGPYTDALSMCLVKQASEGDKTTLVKWMFAIIALHPDVKPMAVVTFEQRDALNEQFATLAQRLLTEACVSEAREALRYEGNSAFEASFNVLGQVASRELFTNPAVAEGMSGLDQYFDEERLETLMKEEPTEQE